MKNLRKFTYNKLDEMQDICLRCLPGKLDMDEMMKYPAHEFGNLHRGIKDKFKEKEWI